MSSLRIDSNWGLTEGNYHIYLWIPQSSSEPLNFLLSCLLLLPWRILGWWRKNVYSPFFPHLPKYPPPNRLISEKDEILSQGLMIGGLFKLTAGLTTPWPNCNFCGWGGVGWGGDDDILWTWTHGGCYATVLVLSLHTWWMLRNCACLVIAHMVDATQLCLSCNCTHGGCYATVLVL